VLFNIIIIITRLWICF